MNIKEYQKYVVDNANPKYDKMLAVIGLMGEVGEVSDVIKKEQIYDDMSLFEKKYAMTVQEKIKDELGDVFWQYMLLVSKYNLTLDEIIEYNVQKLNNRHKGFKTNPNGGNR